MRAHTIIRGLMLAGIFLLVAIVDAAVISVNFTDNRATQRIANYTAAGFGRYTHWNNTTLNSGAMDSLVDSDGKVTTASIQWDSKNTWGDNAARADADRGIGDAQLAYGYLDDGIYYGPCSWTVKDIGYAQYDVVLYLGTDTPGGSYGPFVVNGKAYSTTGTKHTYTNPNWDADNTIIVTGLSGDLVVQGHERNSINPTVRGSAAGFQIIDSSELSFVIKGDSVKVTDCVTHATGMIIIPPTIVGKPVTAIGNNAFRDCSLLTGITVPAGVTSIGHQAFQNCSSLTDITLPDSVTSIGNNALRDCSSLMGITVPAGVTSIGNNAFRDCSSLTSIILPSNLSHLGIFMFYGCSSITGMTIPAGVTNIGRAPFIECGKLLSIEVEPGNLHFSTVGGVLFNADQTELIAYPSAKFGDTYAVPSGVTNISYWAFNYCNLLSEITLPESIRSIDNNAFRGCSSLPDFTIPAGIVRLGAAIFTDCSGLRAINVEPGSLHFSSVDGVLFNKDQTELVIYPGGKPGDTYTVPAGVTIIRDAAFEYCQQLTTITLPAGVTSIGNWVFNYCSSLTSITFPDSLIAIGNFAFRDCSSLMSIVFPDRLNEIGNSAFLDCYGLSSATFLGDAPATLGSEVFTGTDVNFRIYYLSESDGFSSPIWMGYQSVLGIPVDAGDNIQIASHLQINTLIRGSTLPPNGDRVIYRWLAGEAVLMDWTRVKESGAADLDLGTLTYVDCGRHTLTLEVSYGKTTGSDEMLLTVQNSSPEIQPSPLSQTVKIGMDPIRCSAAVADFDGDLVGYSWAIEGQILAQDVVSTIRGGEQVMLPDLVVPAGDPQFPLGSHVLILSVTDGENMPVQRAVLVKVVDTEPPGLRPEPSTTILHPPNHRMHTVLIQANATDDGGAVTLDVDVISSEPNEDLGDGNTAEPDWIVVGIDQQSGVIELQLRAERGGKGDGRSYIVTVMATDSDGNTTYAIIEVRVPHDQRIKKAPVAQDQDYLPLRARRSRF